MIVHNVLHVIFKFFMRVFSPFLRQNVVLCLKRKKPQCKALK